MRIGKYYSHLNGHEWLLVHKPDMWAEITTIIEHMDAEEYRLKESREHGMMGKMLYSPKHLNQKFARELNRCGWDEMRTSYWVTDDFGLIRRTLTMPPDEQKTEIEVAGKRPIFSYNQTDFVKDRVAVEVQMGKYSFVAYDLFVKHMAFYVGDKIDLGIEILPMKCMQAEMSSGPAYYEGAIYDVARQGRGVPAVPLIIIGIEP